MAKILPSDDNGALIQDAATVSQPATRLGKTETETIDRPDGAKRLFFQASVPIVWSTDPEFGTEDAPASYPVDAAVEKSLPCRTLGAVYVKRQNEGDDDPVMDLSYYFEMLEDGE